MTEYGKFTTIKPNAQRSLLSNDRVKEAKEARKKLLERVEQRRRENYKSVIDRLKVQAILPLDNVIHL